MGIVYGLVGAGGHGREIMPILRKQFQDEIDAGNISLVFVVEGAQSDSLVNGYPVISMQDFLQLECDKRFNIAIADSKVRERIANECLAYGIDAFSVVSDSAIVLDCNFIGMGSMISPQTIVTSNVQIGKFFHANNHCNIAHDCVIGDYVTLAPGVRCNGNVHIGDHAYIGAGALIKQGKLGDPLLIGEGAIVGMGAVVTKNVAPYTTVVGNPARLMTKRRL